MLICLIEQLLREAETSGKHSLLRHSHLSDSLIRQLRGFHAGATQWHHLLSLTSSIQQVQNPPPLPLSNIFEAHPSCSLYWEVVSHMLDNKVYDEVLREMACLYRQASCQNWRS